MMFVMAEPISLAEYIERVRREAADGEPAAVDELERWERLQARNANPPKRGPR